MVRCLLQLSDKTLKLMFMPMDSRSLLPQPPLHPVPVLIAMPMNFVMVISQDTWERVFWMPSTMLPLSCQRLLKERIWITWLKLIKLWSMPMVMNWSVIWVVMPWIVFCHYYLMQFFYLHNFFLDPTLIYHPWSNTFTATVIPFHMVWRTELFAPVPNLLMRWSSKFKTNEKLFTKGFLFKTICISKCTQQSLIQ